MIELTALFLPLAAWLVASRRGDWDQLLAATFVTVAVAVPALIVSVSLEVYVFPELIRATLSPDPDSLTAAAPAEEGRVHEGRCHTATLN